MEGLRRTHPSPRLVKDTDSASTDSVLHKHGSPVRGPAIYVYLIQNVFAFGGGFFFPPLYIEQHAPAWRSASTGENVGSTVIPILEWYLTLSSFII